MSSDDCTPVQVTFAEIDGKFDQIMQSMDTIKEKQEEMADDISEIKKAVYDPDSGLYARLRELESWKSTSSRLLCTKKKLRTIFLFFKYFYVKKYHENFRK